MFITNNRTSIHLRQKENLVKQQKVSKYHENNCRCAKSEPIYINSRPLRGRLYEPQSVSQYFETF